jgi:hypothetical protein
MVGGRALIECDPLRPIQAAPSRAAIFLSSIKETSQCRLQLSRLRGTLVEQQGCVCIYECIDGSRISAIKGYDIPGTKDSPCPFVLYR